MRIGVVELHQRFVARLEAHRGERRLDLEHGEGLFACRQRPLSSLPFTIVISPTTVPRTRRAAGEYVEIIADSGCITGARAISETPARTLPDRIMADLGFNLAVAHPGIIVPGGIVRANVLEAEPVIIMEREPGFWRAEFPAGNAAGMIASSGRNIGRRRENGIEEQASHQAQYGRRADDWQGNALCRHR